jgi:hypothetical protein
MLARKPWDAIPCRMHSFASAPVVGASQRRCNPARFPDLSQFLELVCGLFGSKGPCRLKSLRYNCGEQLQSAEEVLSTGQSAFASRWIRSEWAEQVITPHAVSATIGITHNPLVLDRSENSPAHHRQFRIHRETSGIVVRSADASRLTPQGRQACGQLFRGSLVHMLRMSVDERE